MWVINVWRQKSNRCSKIITFLRKWKSNQSLTSPEQIKLMLCFCILSLINFITKSRSILDIFQRKSQLKSVNMHSFYFELNIIECYINNPHVTFLVHSYSSNISVFFHSNFSLYFYHKNFKYIRNIYKLILPPWLWDKLLLLFLCQRNTKY